MDAGGTERAAVSSFSQQMKKSFMTSQFSHSPADKAAKDFPTSRPLMTLSSDLIPEPSLTHRALLAFESEQPVFHYLCYLEPGYECVAAAFMQGSPGSECFPLVLNA